MQTLTNDKKVSVSPARRKEIKYRAGREFIFVEVKRSFS